MRREAGNIPSFINIMNEGGYDLDWGAAEEIMFDASVGSECGSWFCWVSSMFDPTCIYIIP